MSGKNAIKITAVFIFLCSTLFGETAVKRGRNEGTMNIPASNVIGNGNLALSFAAIGSYGTIGKKAEPTIGITVGVAPIIELKAKTAFTDFAGLGTTEIHLQVTTPGNDNLRFFGCAIAGDLYLSTSVDTISASSVAGKPEYSSFMRPSGIVDFDWLALFKTCPLKTYFAFGMVDDPTLLFRYDQLSIKAGFEWKKYRHSGYLDIGTGLYKEKAYGSFAGDRSYLQRIMWFEPGIRYRLFGRHSLLGSLRITAYQDLKQHRPLQTTLVRGTVAIDIPVLFKETNTEAIRTLVFMDREKGEKRDTIQQNIELGKRVESGLDKELKALDLKTDTPDAEQEKEALRKREEIQLKMEEIEKLLEETK